MGPSEPGSAPLVLLVDVEKTYAMGDVSVHALCGVNLTMQRGEFMAVMGSSGSGKSTLMNILGLLDRPSAGQYQLNGVNASALSREQAAATRGHVLGFVFQGFNLLARTAAVENVELPLLYQKVPTAERRKRALQSLERVGLAARARHTSAQLSGGQQQRVAIARALVTNPRLLLADEPTGNLDSRTSLEVMALFQNLNDEGLSIVIVTHETDVSQYAKRVVTMRDGQIISDEPMAHRRIAAQDLQQ